MSKFVLSVGGSLIVTKEGINLHFLKEFHQFIRRQVQQGHKFYLVIGGGATARTYIQAALAAAPVSPADRDWVGIRATRLNAQLLQIIFGPLAYRDIITNPTKPVQTTKPVVFTAGYRPGCSTDYVAVLLAQHNQVDTVINLSNIDYAYDRDPRQFPDAKKLEAVSWTAFRQIVGNRWRPGLNVPFDPVASRAAAKHQMKVVILNGEKLKNLEHCLNGQKFVGTTISSAVGRTGNA
jgi:uridylate kinase